MPTPLRSTRLVPLLLIPALGACAAAPPGTRDAGVVSVVTGGGQSYDVRIGADARANPKVTITPAQAVGALPDVYRALGMEPDVVDPRAGTVGVSTHRVSRRLVNRAASDFFECGLDPGMNRPLADQVPITASVVTRVTPAAGGAELATVVQGTARQTGGNAGTATCRSTGLMEALIGEMVQEAVAPRRPRGPGPVG